MSWVIKLRFHRAGEISQIPQIFKLNSYLFFCSMFWLHADVSLPMESYKTVSGSDK